MMRAVSILVLLQSLFVRDVAAERSPPSGTSFGAAWAPGFKPFYSARQIQARVRRMGRQITRDYRGKKLVVVGVLTGAAPMVTDLVRQIDLPLDLEFVRVKSYDGTKSSGKANLLGTLPENLSGRSVLIVDEIVETGLTTSFLAAELYRRGAADVKIAALIHKPEAARHDAPVHYRGFQILGHNPYLVGYGLDDGHGNYRNLPDIRVKVEGGP